MLTVAVGGAAASTGWEVEGQVSAELTRSAAKLRRPTIASVHRRSWAITLIASVSLAFAPLTLIFRMPAIW